MVYLHRSDERQRAIADGPEPARRGQLEAAKCAMIGHTPGTEAPEDFMKISYRQADTAVDLGLLLGAPGRVRLAGFEPATRCLEGTSRVSLDAARCGSMGSLATLIVASCARRRPLPVAGGSPAGSPKSP